MIMMMMEDEKAPQVRAQERAEVINAIVPYSDEELRSENEAVRSENETVLSDNEALRNEIGTLRIENERLRGDVHSKANQGLTNE